LVRSADLYKLPEDLPAPINDGLCDHLRGATLPPIALPSTAGRIVSLGERSSGRWIVVYAYPRTGLPESEPPRGWNSILGARGCTPQTCAFRDCYGEFRARGVEVYGLSTQTTDYQRELVTRLGLQFEVLSEAGLALQEAMQLPIFVVDKMTLFKRFTLIVRDGVIRHVLYPVFPPDANAGEVLRWLDKRSSRYRKSRSG
jgi:peroxiredoxin